MINIHIHVLIPVCPANENKMKYPEAESDWAV